MFPAKARDAALGSVSYRVSSAGQQQCLQATEECVLGLGVSRLPEGGYEERGSWGMGCPPSWAD